jgi:hypothetical protein
MKKYLIILIGVCILILASCNKQEASYDKSLSGNSFKESVSENSYEESIGKNDIISFTLTETINAERLQKFIDNTDKIKKDRINLIISTDEGDPIITQLYFDGKDIIIAIDNSKDKFAGTDRYKIFYKTISGGSQMKDNLVKYLKDFGFTRT